tara:strand:- start:3107 stop:3640 length:534 start_codon:yes stop_codon:yes gene_type:complete
MMHEVILHNLKDKFHKRQKSMIRHALKYKHRIDTRLGYNYEVDLNKDYSALYEYFLEKCKESFKKITFTKVKPRCWACLLDKDNRVNVWHHHITSSTINSVFYLKLAKTENGIAFNEKDSDKIIPDEFDLLLMKNSLMHKPLLPDNKNDLRITVNMEVFCKESADEIFNKENIRLIN